MGALKSSTGVMQNINADMDVTEIRDVMKNFAKEMAKAEGKGEMMDDAFDMLDGADTAANADEVYDGILGEIGLEVASTGVTSTKIKQEEELNFKKNSNMGKPQPNAPKPMVIVADGRRKVHTTFPDGGEKIEEYDVKTDQLMLRKTRKAHNPLGKACDWVIEVGQQVERFDPHSDLLGTSAGQPVFMRKDTKKEFQWRIRNLTWPEDNYQVTIDHDPPNKTKGQIVLRTVNKKYFKRIDIADMEAEGLGLDEDDISWEYQHNTVIISYKKPAVVLKKEEMALMTAKTQAIQM